MTKQGNYDSPLKATLNGLKDMFGSKERIAGLSDLDRLDGKTVLITGASSGLGNATALQLAERGGKIIMAVRSGIPEKGKEIADKTGNPNVQMKYVDLSDFDSIDNLLDELIIERIKIDVFVSNAAVVLLKSRQTKQGLEEMFMVNYLAPFYLINKCIENNIMNENGRIVIVASESHRNSKSFDLGLIDGYREYGLNETVAMYGYYKMLLVSFAKTLSEKHPEFIVKSLCPGPVNSKIAREAPRWMTPLLKVVFSAFFRSPEKACEPVVYFSAKNNLSEEFAYLYLMNYKEIDPKTNDDKNGELLWKKSHEIVKTSGFSLQ